MTPPPSLVEALGRRLRTWRPALTYRPALLVLAFGPGLLAAALFGAALAQERADARFRATHAVAIEVAGRARRLAAVAAAQAPAITAPTIVPVLADIAARLPPDARLRLLERDRGGRMRAEVESPDADRLRAAFGRRAGGSIAWRVTGESAGGVGIRTTLERVR